MKQIFLTEIIRGRNQHLFDLLGQHTDVVIQRKALAGGLIRLYKISKTEKESGEHFHFTKYPADKLDTMEVGDSFVVELRGRGRSECGEYRNVMCNIEVKRLVDVVFDGVLS